MDSPPVKMFSLLLAVLILVSCESVYEEAQRPNLVSGDCRACEARTIGYHEGARHMFVFSDCFLVKIPALGGFAVTVYDPEPKHYACSYRHDRSGLRISTWRPTPVLE